MRYRFNWNQEKNNWCLPERRLAGNARPNSSCAHPCSAEKVKKSSLGRNLCLVTISEYTYRHIFSSIYDMHRSKNLEKIKRADYPAVKLELGIV